MSSPRSHCLRALHSLRQPIRPKHLHRRFHLSRRLGVVKPFLLADIGEGITECQLIQWFVAPGARVEQFDRLCEVQSDKASVEITSPFDGVIKHLHYEPDDMAITGKPLVDIDIQGEISAEDEAKIAGEGAVEQSNEDVSTETGESMVMLGEASTMENDPELQTLSQKNEKPERHHRSRQNNMGALATPAVRHLTKELKIDISNVNGTGRDGRVLKEDVHRHVARAKQDQDETTPRSASEDRKLPLTPVQMQMFRIMTRSLSIPHFLYSSTANMTALTALRKSLNASTTAPDRKLTNLAFILKAVSLAFVHHPLLNSSLDSTDPKKPELRYKGAHNFGVAIDAPMGLVVPVVKNVGDLSILDIAAQISHFSQKAKENKLAPADFSGATFTISNIGSIGGGVVSPVISEPQVAILGIGRSKIVPAFDEEGKIVKREELVLSWSADHRVVDGAACARCAERVRVLLEAPGTMMVEMK